MILKSDVEKSRKLSIAGVIIFTILFSGPLTILIPTITDFIKGVSTSIIIIGPVSAISIYLIVLLWKSYFANWRYGRNIDIHKEWLRIITAFFLVIEALVSIIEIAAAIAGLQQWTICPADYIFYQNKYTFIIFIFEAEIMLVYYTLMYKFTEADLFKGGCYLIKIVKKSAVLIVLANIALVYLSVSGITVATDKAITDYDWNNLNGTEYSYNDINAVDTGFEVGRRRNSDAEFYYAITFKDGKMMKFTDTSAAEKYDDTYTDNVAFDKIVMNSGNVKKTGSTYNAKYCSMDKKYIDRLCSVINYKK